MNTSNDNRNISVRLPSLEVRRKFAAKCLEDGVTQTGFIAEAVQAYLSGRLQITTKQTPRPSYLIDPQD
ncbi:hypothetical protein EOM89_10430 [Candidatus Falkowbacteria bacterium]|nr:hypothetical protein [Candidatus Falkowbacteria bacterium]